MKKIGLVVKNDQKAIKKALELEEWLKTKNIEIIKKEDYCDIPYDLFCVFVLGGDGTFLSAVRWIGDKSVPIFGIKFGEVGFLAESTEENLFYVVQEILNGNFTINKRMRLQAEVIREKFPPISENVLNDIVINRGALARLASIQTYINDHYLTTYKADGLIISTPTGSTAYSLAAGGPVIHPDVECMIMTPICPFTLTNRPLIVSDSVVITMKLEKGTNDIMVTFDGQSGFMIDDKSIIIVKKTSHHVNMITLPNHNYFDVLKAKLRWSGSRV